ncbi:hypothetical protein ACIRD3_00875 [Kitasatospora sp. NPDC093550]|uniref:hypothetical protein n=1 Tax=Kitasatospora sp. NPDC093550 TaxID=3364089 RepID=UPI0037F28094
MGSGEGADLVGAVVAALVQAASGVAGAAGTALGAEAVGWVREGLGQLPRWAQAAERVDSAPQDDGARRGLADAVGELLRVHPALAESLAERLAQAVAPVGLPPAPPAPPPSITVGEGAFVGGAGQTAVGSGNTVVGGDVHHNTVHKRGSGGLVVAILVVVAALVALGIHFLGGNKDLGSTPLLPASVEGDALRPGSDRDWEGERASLTRDGMENPQLGGYGKVPNAFSDRKLGGDEHEVRWTVYIADATMTFQRRFAELRATSSTSRTPFGREVPTSLPGKMYCDASEAKNGALSDDDERSCLWFDDKHVIVVRAYGRDPILLAAVVERIYHNSER